jgi:hypothetical protein
MIRKAKMRQIEISAARRANMTHCESILKVEQRTRRQQQSGQMKIDGPRKTSRTYLCALASEIVEFVTGAVVIVRDQIPSYAKSKYTLVAGRQVE